MLSRLQRQGSAPRMGVTPAAAGSGRSTTVVRAQRTALLVPLVMSLWAVGLARAAPLPNGNRMIAFALVEQDLPSVLTEIATQVGLRADVSPKVSGDVHGRLPAASVRQTLDRLSDLYGFDWYCDGRKLFVSSPSEAQTRLLPLGTVDADVLARTLEDFGESDDRWPLRFSGGGDVVLVAGPPHYVAAVQQTLHALEQRQKEAPVVVAVFRGGTG